MDTLTFHVQGSAADPYTVTFEREGTNLNAYCTCPAGENGQYCKHRFSILSGSDKGVVGDASDVATVKAWLPGTDVEEALSELAEAEHDADAAKKRVQAAKKTVARAMRE